MSIIKTAIDNIIRDRTKQFISPYTLASKLRINVNEINDYMKTDNRLRERFTPHTFSSFEIIGFNINYK